MFRRSGGPAPANVVAWCILCSLVPSLASPPPYEVRHVGNTSNGLREDHSAWERGGQELWLARILSTAGQTLTRGSFQDPLARRLAPILPVHGWVFPFGTTLQLQSQLQPMVFGSGYPQAVQLTVLAGYRYQSLSIEVSPGEEFGAEHTGATLKLVDEQVTRAVCHNTPYLVPMAMTEVGTGRGVSPLGLGATLRLLRGTTQLFATTTQPDLVFMQGGMFKLCYTPDGTFAGDEFKNAILPVTIAVVGVYSSCTTNGCLEQEHWHCYFSYRAEVEGPCRVDIRLNGGRRGWGMRSDQISRMVWSATWANDRYFNGDFIQAPRQLCSDAGSVTVHTIVPDEYRLTSLPSHGLKSVPLDKEKAGLMPPVRKETASDSFTVSACYCPNFDNMIDPDEDACNHPSEFIQSIGVIYYWTVRVCDRQGWASCGVTDPPYARVLPHQPFVLRLQCPPGGICAGATENRLRLIAVDTSGQEERPFWDFRERCKTVTTELPGLQWLSDSGAFASDLSGGARRDYKVWYERYLLSTQTVGEEFDVCYCDDGCFDQKNYIKVSRIRNVESMSVARWTQVGSTGIVDPIVTVEFINKAGTITLMGGVPSPLTEGILPFDSVPFSRQVMLKLISYDREAYYTDPGGYPTTLERFSGMDRSSEPIGQFRLDAACGAVDWSATLNTGPVTEELAKEFMANIHGGPSTTRAAFSGVENDQSFTVLKAGSLVVCYCAMIGDTGACSASEYWIAATRILLRGPVGGANINFPTTYVVRVDIEGWGFDSTDTLRFIGMTQSCNEDGFAPLSRAGYRLGCPGMNATDCRLPSLLEDIVTILDDVHTTGVYIEFLEISEYNTTLVFTGDITKALRDGDMITIDSGSVLLGGRNASNWTLSEAFVVAKLTGVIPYADEPAKTRIFPHRVSYVYGPGRTLDTRRLSLPVGWPQSDRPPFTFVGNRGGWAVRNRLRTNQELKADKEVTLRMCWGASDGATQKYYGDAGVVRFVDPANMADAGVYFTSLVVGTVAPVMISFTPDPSRTGYASFHVPTVLRLLFRDTTGMLEPLLVGNEALGPLPLDPESEVPLEQATQALCGMLFTEMWTNDATGFPVPRGCYYSRQYQDIATGSGDEPTYREYGIVFEPRQGLKTQCFDYRINRGNPCIYTFVLTARIGDQVVSVRDDIVSIFTACVASEGGENPCGPRYSVIEYGAGTPRLLPSPANPAAPQLGRMDMTPAGSGGVRPEALELTGNAPDGSPDIMGFEFRAYPRDPQLPIQKRARLQIFFLPLTIWSIGQGPCTARCESAPGFACLDGRGGHVAECQVEAVARTKYETVVRQQKNSLYLRYPMDMEVIPGSANVAHVLNVSQFELPNQGFFALRFLAQLRDTNAENPSMVWISGTVTRVPRYGQTSGRLLFDGPTGSGPKPFAGDRKNELLVRLVLGATLQHVILPPPGHGTAVVVPDDGQDNETDAPAPAPGAPAPSGPAGPHVYPPPTIELTLPEGYTCFVYDQGRLDPTREIFKQDGDGNGFLDNYRGFLTLGHWTVLDRRCIFTLAPFAAIHPGQVFFVRIKVDNPQVPLKRDDPRNVWHLSFAGSNMTTLGSPVRFISLIEELALPGWAGNVAVIRPLKEESLQPSVFSIGATNELSIFYKAVDDMPEKSLVLVDAPLGFDFTASCQASDLDVSYYADWHSIAWGEDLTGPRSRTQSLGEGKNCTPDQWNRDWLLPPPTTNFTRARVAVPRRMVRDRYYAFSITVRNAREYSPSQHSGWGLWILSPEGYPVAGSKATVQFNQERIDTLPHQPYDRSWGMYADPPLLPLRFDFNASSVFPTRVPIMTTLLTVYPFGVRTDGVLRSLRVIAPQGYEWDLDGVSDFSGSVPGLTTKVCDLYTQPYSLLGNELILPDIVLRVGCLHGFQVRIRIPTFPATRSSNAFFFELGYDQSAGYARYSAGTVPAPPLRVISDASVFSLCNAVGYRSNELEFHLRIVSELRMNEGFVFQGDEMTRGTILECWPEAVKGSLPMPTDAKCSIFRHELTGLPMVILSAGQEPFAPGFYAFRFNGVENPVHSGSGYWLMGTYGDVHLYPQLKTLDMASNVPGPRTRNLMQDAGLLAAPPWQMIALGRDDRPGATNKIIFYFRLFARPLSSPSIPVLPLALRGPLGFIFEEFCLNSLIVLSPANPMNGSKYSNISGSFPCEHGVTEQESWCPYTFAAWPPLLQPVDCWGSGSSAMISVPNYAHLEDAMQEAPASYFGFEAGAVYAFQIMGTNPFQDYAPTKWALDFGHEASKPFSSFVLKTFDVTLTTLRPASTTVRNPNDIVTPETPNAGFLPVNVQFVPSTELPAARAGLEDIGAPVPVGALRGSVTLQAPVGFTFHHWFDGGTRTYPCIGILLEVAGHEPGDLEAKYRLGQDIKCIVLPPHFSELQITLSGAKVLRARVPYRLVVMTRNPLMPQLATPWVLLTYMEQVGMSNMIPIDRFAFTGFEVATGISRWYVDNYSKEYMGDAEVMSVRFTIMFTRDVLNGDSIRITTVSGVSMHAGGGLCKRFRWTNIQPPAWVLPLPNSPMPVCSCQGGLCDLRLNIMEGDPGFVALLRSQEMAFEVSAVNPHGPPDIIDNFWMVQHLAIDGALIASDVVAGWPVYGQLRELSVDITGINTRAGSVTALGVEFRPAVWAGVMDLEVHEPPGFDFVKCIPSSPLAVERSYTQGARLVVSNGNFPGGQKSIVLLSQVQLGNIGGQTRISILLYEELRQTPVNRRLNFLQGFQAPGSLSIVEQRLWSQDVVAHHEGGKTDEVVPMLPAHSGQLARLDLFFVTTNSASPGEQFRVRSLTAAPTGGMRFQPRVDVDRPASLVACRRDDTPATCTDPMQLGLEEVTVVIDQLDLFPYGLDMQLNATSPIEVGRLYRFRFWCIPSQGLLYWGVSTKERTGLLPTNTNDGSSRASAAVAQLNVRVELFAARNPPQSVVPVRIVVRSTDSSKDFTVVRIVMPRGYVRLGLQPPADPETSARIVVSVDRSSGSGHPQSTGGWKCDMQIVTPSRNVSDTRWFVLVSGSITDWGQPSLSHASMLGWSMAPGFVVTALTVRFAYAGVPLFRGWLSVTFQLPTYMRGKYVLITSPVGFELSCPEGANLFPLVCSRTINYRSTNNIGDASRTINVTLPSGSVEGTDRLYVFMLGITTPESITDANTWDMRVADAGLNIVDSALGVSGRTFMRSTLVENPTLAWDRQPMSGERSIATIEVTFMTRIRYVKALLISLPERYRHDIQHPNQFKCLNKALPLAVDVQWRNYESVRWVRVLLATTDPGGGLDFVPAGIFQFRFPVMIPVEQPVSTEWYFSMCSSFDCQSPDDQHIVVTFPIPNTRPILPARVFSANLVPTTALTAGAARAAAQPLAVVWPLLLGACLWATAPAAPRGTAGGCRAAEGC